MPTIKDVARKAKVSVGTVSNVINNLETVTEKNRKKVKEVIEKLGYHPNKIAASLSKKMTMNIGLIVPDISSPFYSDLIKGISETLYANDYNIFLCESNGLLEKETKIISDLLSMWIDGIILIPVYASKRDVKFFESFKTPIVFVNREIKGLKKDFIVFDNYGGAYEAADFLIKNGFKKIVLLSGPEISESFEERLKGFTDAMNENGLYDENMILRGDFSVESGHMMMRRAFKQIKKFDSVFAASDLIALGALSAIEENGLKVPEDISVIGFGDIYLSKFLKPSLTTIRRPFYNIGKIAVSILLDRIHNEKNDIKKFVVKGKLEIRNSVKIRK